MTLTYINVFTTKPGENDVKLVLGYMKHQTNWIIVGGFISIFVCAAICIIIKECKKKKAEADMEKDDHFVAPEEHH